jgi:gas vesicle protein
MPRNGRSFLSGLISGVALSLGAAIFLSPEARKKLKPMVVKGMKKTAEITENVRAATAKAMEDFEDIIAEAKYETIKNKETETVNLGEMISLDKEKH